MCHQDLEDDEGVIVETEEPHVFHRDCLSFLVQRARTIFEHPVLRFAFFCALALQAYVAYEAMFRPWLKF